MHEIAVGIITFRRPESLAITLDSLLHIVIPQDVSVRLIIADNDIHESARHIVDGFKDKTSFPVNYIVEPVQGIPHARNAILRTAAQYDYIAFIDDDDTADAQWLSALYKAAQFFQADVVKGRVIYSFPKGKEYLAGLDAFVSSSQATGTELDSAWTNNVLFSTRIYKNKGLTFDPDFVHTGGSDHHFFRTAKNNGAKLVACREAIIHTDVPLKRTTWQWLAMRNMRMGATMTISDRKMQGFLYAVGRIIYAVSDSLPYVFRLLPGVFYGNNTMLHPVMVLFFIIGRMTGLFQISPREYLVRHRDTKRIAYILGSFPVLSETFIGNEIRALEAQGYIVFPIALHKNGQEAQPEDAAIADRTLYFSAIDESEARKLLRQYTFRFGRIFKFVSSQTTEPHVPLMIHAAHLANYIKTNGCMHVHAHFAWGAATYAIAAAKLLKLPITFTCHGSDVYARPIDLRLKCELATAVVAVAPTLAEDIQKIAPRTPCHTIYCGVDTDRFKPLANKERKHARWLFTGRLIDCKGVDDILAAWALLPEHKRPSLDIVGEGVLREQLEQYIASHNLQSSITLLGAKSSDWIVEHAPYYHAYISAFKEGSDGSKDTAPLVLKEAMAMALPIVTTNFRDIPKVVDKECALICDAGSPETLAQAVMQMKDFPQETLQRMGYAGRQRVEKYFSLKEQAEKLTELFDFYKKQ